LGNYSSRMRSKAWIETKKFWTSYRLWLTTAPIITAVLMAVSRRGSSAAMMNILDVIINGAAGAAFLGIIVFIGTVVIGFLRAPVLLDEDAKRENDALRAELFAIQNRERPAIVIRRHSVDDRTFYPLQNSCFSSLNLLFANDASGVTEDCTARNVVARVQFSDSSGSALCEVDAGRWGDADQPRDSIASRVPLRRVDFPIGETRELNVAIKFSSDGRCFGVDNDYVATRGRRPSLEITEEIVSARVRLLGVGVNSEWVIRFENPSVGRLRVLSVEPS
jgi:hypothetical protein